MQHDAKQILRRDLAILRERDAFQAQNKARQESANIANDPQDVEMIDVETAENPIKEPELDIGRESKEAKPDIDVIPKKEPNFVSPQDDASSSRQVADSPADAKPDVKELSSSTNNAEEDVKPTDALTSDHATSADGSVPPDLSLDTTGHVGDDASKTTATKDDEETVPETANTDNNTADLDSLFNGPLSASAENNDFSFGQENNGEIDFGSFAGDNDNISSLLPGLQDYANPQSDTASGHDFDSMLEINGASSGEQATGNTSGGGEQETFNFEEFMNSNHFDANGNITNIGGVNNDGNEDENQQQFDFDALFE